MHSRPIIQTHGENSKMATFQWQKAPSPLCQLVLTMHASSSAHSWRSTLVLLGFSTTAMQDSVSSWLLQNYRASQRISRASSNLQEAKQLSTTTFPQAKSNESMGPSLESKKPLKVMGIHLLLRAVSSTTSSRMHTSQMSMCHRSSTSMTPVRSSTRTMCQRGSVVILWAPVKKEKNLMYMSGNKKHAVKVRDKTVDLKETKDFNQ